MVLLLTLISGILSFLVTFLMMPYWIKRATHAKLLGKDVHKNHEEIPELGGLVVVSGFLAGILCYIAVGVFIYKNIGIVSLFAATTCVLIATIIGLVDDILGWKIGLRQYQKAILTFAIALPLMVVNAGDSVIYIPFLGEVSLGLFYPLLLIPLGVVGASNGFNMIAGYNGLEAGMGAIILFFLGYVSWFAGDGGIAILALCMVGSLLAFLWYNKYPAKIFPGDTLTYSVGAMIAIVAILGNIEKFALVLFIPYFFELILKSRGLMQKESFAKLCKDGKCLVKPYKKYYGLEHIVVDLLNRFRGKCHERDVVVVFYLIEIFLGFVVIIML